MKKENISYNAELGPRPDDAADRFIRAFWDWVKSWPAEISQKNGIVKVRFPGAIRYVDFTTPQASPDASFEKVSSLPEKYGFEKIGPNRWEREFDIHGCKFFVKLLGEAKGWRSGVATIGLDGDEVTLMSWPKEKFIRNIRDAIEAALSEFEAFCEALQESASDAADMDAYEKTEEP